MAFCINCGKNFRMEQSSAGNCGKAVKESNSSDQRKTVYDGEIHKCPSCGEVLNAFVSECPSCGYELRGTKASTSVREFALKLELASTERQTITLIKNYPIPNAKEDIYEYMIIAASNITSDSNREVLEAWKD